MGDINSEIEDIEEDPPQQMEDVYEQLSNARLLDLDPDLDYRSSHSNTGTISLLRSGPAS